MKRFTSIVRPPPQNYASGLITHIPKPTTSNFALALRQWKNYCAILGEYSSVIYLPPLEDIAPDSHFVEDAVVSFSTSEEKVAILTNPGAPERKFEVQAIRNEIECSNLFDRIETIDQGGFDGGDVLKCTVSNRVYVGKTTRTCSESIQQLQTFLPDHDVIPVVTTKALHLKSCVTMLPRGEVIGFSPLVDAPEIYDQFIPMPEEQGAHIVVLNDNEVLMSEWAPESKRIISSLGYGVRTVDISEFEKMEGCVTCLSVRIR